MSEPLVSIDVSRIHDERLEDVKLAMRELVEFVQANEPDPFAYHVYFDETGTWMTVFQVHPDSASMEFHMETAGPAFRGLSEYLTLTRIDIYGTPSERLMSQLGAKAQMLGGAKVAVHAPHAGFTRFGST